MSYRGRPSKGCEPCRARKVKCDETKPTCNRCRKSRRSCKYRDQADLLFRNQTAFAAQRAEESWRKRSKSYQHTLSENNLSLKSSAADKALLSRTARQPSVSRHGSISHRPSIVSSHQAQYTSPNEFVFERTDTSCYDDAAGYIDILGSRNLTIAPVVRPDLRRLAYERFVYDFVAPETPNRPLGETSDALWTFIPALYQNAPEDSCLAIIVNAVAYANFANRCNAPQANAWADEALGKGIALLSKSILDGQKAASDETLCSVYLMGVFENLRPAQRKGVFLTHQHGATALLQLRSIGEYYSNPVSARLYEVAYCQTLLGNLQAARAPTMPVRKASSLKEYLPGLYNNSNTFVIRLIHNEAILHARWHEYKANDNLPNSRLELRDLLQTALELDAEYQSWEATIPQTWKYTMGCNTLEVRSTYDAKWQQLILGSRGAPEEVHSYTTLKRCWIWSYFRTSRIFLLRDTLEILHWMFRLPEPKLVAQRMDSIHDLTDANILLHKDVPSGLDTLTLRFHHSFATAQLVSVFEKCCSAVISSFTVPVYSRSFEDVMGMRGYINLWTLGILDAVLKSGLIPDSNAPTSPPKMHSSPATTPSSVASHNGTFNASLPNMQLSDQLFSSSDPFQVPEFPHHCLSDSHPALASAAPTTRRPSPAPGQTRIHIFDSSTAHPWDFAVNLPALDCSITKVKSVDIAAKREWLNRMLYYIGSELGIKKALYSPTIEGFLHVVKPQVDEILGR